MTQSAIPCSDLQIWSHHRHRLQYTKVATRVILQASQFMRYPIWRYENNEIFPSISHCQYRARLDAIRGPPVSLVAQLPVRPYSVAPTESHLIKERGESKSDPKPVLIRANIKSGVRIENLQVIFPSRHFSGLYSPHTPPQIPPNFPRYLWLSSHITDFADHIRIFNKNVLVTKCSRYKCPRMYERKDHAFVWSYDDKGDASKTIRRKVFLPSSSPLSVT
jgi:hypothetical protein